MPKRNLTQADLDLLEETFANKDEVRTIVQEELRAQVGQLPTKDEFFSKMDQLMGEVKAMRETQELHAQSHNDVNDKLGKHDQRLKKLEAVTSTN